MEYRPMDITIISADNLKDVNLMSKMDVYVAVSVSGDPRTLRRTPVHRDGGKSPRWNHKISLPVSDNAYVVFRIFSDRILGDKEIGEVSVPVRELVDAARNSGDCGERVVEYQVRTVSGKTKGTLKFSYKFGEKTAAPQPPLSAAPPPYVAAPTPYAAEGKSSGEPVTAYPAQHAAAYPPYDEPYPPKMGYAPPQQGYGYVPPQQGYGYPPPQQGYGYAPPQQGYGYAPPQQGYGYAPPQQGYGYGVVPPKKKKQGMGGLGLGLGAGLLGGLLVGDMISDVGDYDAGYDAGFDDGGGFDF